MRELQVYCELFPWDASEEAVLAINPQGFILSGGPASVYDAAAPSLPDYILQQAVPVLGICYGMQLLVRALGGEVAGSEQREYGLTRVNAPTDSVLFEAGDHPVWMSHGDIVQTLPEGFQPLAHSQHGIIAGMRSADAHIFGLQFHPEVNHTVGGLQMLEKFIRKVCNLPAQPGQRMRSSPVRLKRSARRWGANLCWRLSAAEWIRALLLRSCTGQSAHN